MNNMHDKKAIYSPIQAGLGSFLGGPLAAIVFIKSNFRALDNIELEKRTLHIGAIIILTLIALLPFLPESFPATVIGIATILLTRIVVEKYQVTKQQIIDSEELYFQSNWRVVGVALVSLIIFLLMSLTLAFILDYLGIITLD